MRLLNCSTAKEKKIGRPGVRERGLEPIRK